MKKCLLRDKFTLKLMKVYKAIDEKDFENHHYQKDSYENYIRLKNTDIEKFNNNKYGMREVYKEGTDLYKKISFPIIIKHTAFDTEPYYECFNIKSRYIDVDVDGEKAKIYDFYDNNDKKLPEPHCYKIVSVEELDSFKS